MKTATLPIILALLAATLISGCVQGGGFVYTTEGTASPITVTATFSDKPLVDQAVDVDLVFKSEYEDEKMPVTIELYDSFSLVEGSLTDNLDVVDGSAQKTVRIRAKSTGYHKITIIAEAESIGYSRTNTIHLEITENNARVETNPDVRWYE